MRSFYYKETIEPDIKRRNYLLRKLAYLKSHVKSDKKGQELIKTLRRQLKATDGKTLYYRCNKGLKVLIGNDTTPKKNFLIAKDPRYLQTVISKLRAQNKIEPRIVYRERYVASIDKVFYYKMVGGVMATPGYFNSELKKVQKHKVKSIKRPRKEDTNPYIGIELEYATNLSLDDIAEKLIEAKLHESVRMMHDGSIRCNEIYPNPIEFCILTKWSDLKSILDRLKPIIFDKPQNFCPNLSCGFHVHLDVRHDNPQRVFKNLTSMQSVLFNLAADHRRDNKYCQPQPTSNWHEVDEEAEDAHYAAVSKFSYYKHNTIEVRIHESTLNLNKIEKWITLLKRIADYKGDGMKLGTFDSELKVLKEKVKIEPELVKYIEEINL